jgi:hypothetical protein
VLTDNQVVHESKVSDKQGALDDQRKDDTKAPCRNEINRKTTPRVAAAACNNKREREENTGYEYTKGDYYGGEFLRWQPFPTSAPYQQFRPSAPKQFGGEVYSHQWYDQRDASSGNKKAKMEVPETKRFLKCCIPVALKKFLVARFDLWVRFKKSIRGCPANLEEVTEQEHLKAILQLIANSEADSAAYHNFILALGSDYKKFAPQLPTRIGGVPSGKKVSRFTTGRVNEIASKLGLQATSGLPPPNHSLGHNTLTERQETTSGLPPPNLLLGNEMVQQDNVLGSECESIVSLCNGIIGDRLPSLNHSLGNNALPVGQQQTAFRLPPPNPLLGNVMLQQGTILGSECESIVSFCNGIIGDSVSGPSVSETVVGGGVVAVGGSTNTGLALLFDAITELDSTPDASTK